MKLLLWIVFLASLAARFRVIGWFLILFGLIDIGLRAAVFYLNLRFLQHANSPSDWFLLIASQILVLLSALFTIDFSDVDSYTLLGKVRNPGKFYFRIYLLCTVSALFVNFIIAFLVWKT